MKSKTAPCLALALTSTLALGTPGCATILRGTTDDVTIESESPTAALSVDGTYVHRGEVELDRGSSHTVTAEEPWGWRCGATVHSRLSWGYTLVDSLIAVVFFPFGLIFPIVDLVDGAAFNLEPDPVVLPRPYGPRHVQALPPGAELR